MACIPLSQRDINVLERLKDPEAEPCSIVQTDPTVPRDPHITNPTEYSVVAAREKEIIVRMQQLELELANLRSRAISDPVLWYRTYLSQLDELIDAYPNYGSARNNRAQILRRMYGDTMLIQGVESPGLVTKPLDEEKKAAALKALVDLETSIILLSPASPRSPISPQAAKTLSLAHTQQAAIYHATAKDLMSRQLALPSSRLEASWKSLDFEEAASRHFAIGGRYGNEIAKGLAVSTNPMAKLCGQMVREAMRKEYGPACAK